MNFYTCGVKWAGYGVVISRPTCLEEQQQCSTRRTRELKRAMAALETYNINPTRWENYNRTHLHTRFVMMSTPMDELTCEGSIDLIEGKQATHVSAKRA